MICVLSVSRDVDVFNAIYPSMCCDVQVYARGKYLGMRNTIYVYVQYVCVCIDTRRFAFRIRVSLIARRSLRCRVLWTVSCRSPPAPVSSGWSIATLSVHNVRKSDGIISEPLGCPTATDRIVTSRHARVRTCQAGRCAAASACACERG